jgi:glutamate 5-kinase
MLVLLTDIEGLFTADPRTNPEATVISVVQADDPLLTVTASGAGTNRGSGGMSSKLAAARIASWSGVTAIISSASHDGAVMSAIAGHHVGTCFLPHDRHLSARRLWIAFAAEVEGSVVVDNGARDAIVTRGTSLLPAGVTEVRGTFDTGATIEVIDENGDVIARGMTAMTSAEVLSSAGKRTADLADLSVVEVLHRDDLVVLTGA